MCQGSFSQGLAHHPPLLLKFPWTASIWYTASSQVAALWATGINHYFLSGVMACQCLQLYVLQPDWRSHQIWKQRDTRVASLPAVLSPFPPQLGYFSMGRARSSIAFQGLSQETDSICLTTHTWWESYLHLIFQPRWSEMMPVKSFKETACCPVSLAGPRKSWCNEEIYSLSHTACCMCSFLTQLHPVFSAGARCRTMKWQLPLQHGLSRIYGTL